MDRYIDRYAERYIILSTHNYRKGKWVYEINGQINIWTYRFIESQPTADRELARHLEVGTQD